MTQSQKRQEISYIQYKYIRLVVPCVGRLLKHILEGNIQGEIEVTGRRGRRRKQLLDYLKETRGHWKLKEEALDRTLWKIRFGRGTGTVGIWNL